LAFSPRAEALLYEAKRISNRLGSDLVLIHAGEKNGSLEKRMKLMLSRVGIDQDKVEIVWEEGKPLDVLTDVCQRENINLLVLGAIQNEAMLRYYIGSIARKISRRPPCSLLLVTDPQKKSSKLNSVVVNGIDHPKTENTILKTLDFSKAFDVNEVIIVEEVKASKLKTRIDDNETLEKAFEEREIMRKAENERMADFVRPLQKQVSSNIKMKCVFGKEGYSIGHFAEVKNADLLVMNSPDKKLGFLDRFFPHDLEYVLSDMPCDLMIVHPD